MALTDNLISQIYPVAGETSILDAVSTNTFSGAGTPTLADGDGGVKCWVIPANADLRTALAGIDTTTGNYEFTIAYRVKLVANGSDSFASLAGIIPAAGDIVADGARLLRSGAILRARFANQSVLDFTGVTGLNTLQTVVVKYFAATTSGTDQIFAWIGGLARTGDTPNFTSATQNWNQRNFDTIFLTGTSGASYQLYDMAIWNRGLTDAEAASVADDYRAVMPAPSGGPATVTSAISAGLPTPSAASTVTVQSTTISFTVAAGLPVPSANSSVTIVPAVGDPIFTSEPLRDNAGTLLVSEALDYVAIYDNTTGALVLRETGLSTNASGVFSVQSALLTSGVTYKVDWKVTSQLSARMPAKAAV